jgi:hypothetical protein
MARTPDDQGDAREIPPPDEPAADRLDSWKEIANYLDRDVRTAQRWEKYAGLPVHRHARSRLRSAYAYRSELEAWRRAQEVVGSLPDAAATESTAAPPGRTAEPDAPASAFSRRRWGGLVAAVLTLAVLTGAAMLGGRPREAAAPADSAVLVVTAVEDNAGEPRLSGVIDGLLGRELRRQPGLHLVEPVRVRQILRLMRLGPDAVLTPALGRELAQRDGGVSFVIASKLNRLTAGYFLVVQAVTPVDGVVRASIERRGKNEAELLEEIAGGLRELRAALPGGTSTRTAPERLERVTTASMNALRLYTAAVRAGGRRQWRASELLARRAIGADARLAVAHAWAGWAMRQQGHPVRQCLDATSPALVLARDATDAESYLVSGMHHAIAGDLPAAIAAYEALRGLDPQNSLARDLLTEAYSRVGRVNEAVDLSVERAVADHDGFYANAHAAHALVVWRPDPLRAVPFVTRAHEVRGRHAYGDRSRWSAWLAGLPVFQSWLAGSNAAALDTLTTHRKALDGMVGRERDDFATMIGSWHMALGRIKESSEIFRHGATPRRQLAFALQSLVLDDEAGARAWLLRVREHGAARPALFARVGLAAEATRGLAHSPPVDHAEGIAAVTYGLIAARNGDRLRAEVELARGRELLRFSGELEYFFAAEALARLAASAGDVQRAVDVLADAVGNRGRAYSVGQWAAAYWLKLHHELARHLRRTGREAEARAVDTRLRALLSLADAGHPFAPRTMVAATSR